MKALIITISISLILAITIQAQTTVFTYQGRLLDNSTPANGSFDLQFSLYDNISGGNQLGSTNTISNVPVNAGVFTVKLNFGEQFSGESRFLEIKVRAANSSNTDPYTTLSPRQGITSTPYAIKSKKADTADLALNALNADNAIGAVEAVNALNADNSLKLGGFLASAYTLTNDSRLSDARTPLPGSASYIQNRPANVFPPNPQPSSSFNISGTGQAQIFDAVQFNSNGSRILYQSSSLFVGGGSGANATSGSSIFIGEDTGKNSVGSENYFIGQSAGENNSGITNLFFGGFAGSKNTGDENTFLGHNTGLVNTGGNNNVFVGMDTGKSNTTGDNNSFLGYSTGLGNITGSNNTLIGNGANVNNGNLIFATAIGSGARVLRSNEIALGRTNGNDKVAVYGLGNGGVTQLCRNGLNQISTCSSSIRYKSNIKDFSFGIDLVKKLRPVSFKWKQAGFSDMGLVAEEVAEIEPLLTTFKDGRVEGVKYDRIGVVLINAVKEQQTQIESQKKQITNQTKLIESQQTQINALKAFICTGNPTADFCQEKKK